MRRRILIIDDERDILDISATILRAGGFEVATLMGGLERLEPILDESPDLVLLDLRMPVATGDEMLRAMKQDARFSQIPVVLFSSNHEGELGQLSAELGAAGYLPKSALGRNLVGKVKGLMERLSSPAAI